MVVGKRRTRLGQRLFVCLDEVSCQPERGRWWLVWWEVCETKCRRDRCRCRCCPLSNDGTQYQTVACVGDIGCGRVLMVDGVEWMGWLRSEVARRPKRLSQARSKIASSKLVRARPARSRVLCFGWRHAQAHRYRIISCTVQVRLAATSEVWFQQRWCMVPRRTRFW